MNKHSTAPLGVETLYLDSAATAPPHQGVLEAMWPFLVSEFSNPSSPYAPASGVRKALETARAAVAEQLNARPAEIIFTSGGTESDNAAVKGITLAAGRAADGSAPHVLVSAVEHSAVLASARWLEKFGIEVEQVPVDRQGRVNPKELASLLRDSTVLVSIQSANNEVGTCQDIAALTEVTHGAGVRFHCDAVQSAAHQRINVSDWGVDALSLSGHKLGTPKGIGVLYLRRNTPFEALIHGGNQQRGLRSGTEDASGAVGMAKALEIAASNYRHANELERRRDKFISAVLDTVPGAALTGDPVRRLPGHASFLFPGRSGESLVLDLEQEGILCSAGSACTSQQTEPSHVLTAMGYSSDHALSALRFSFDLRSETHELQRVTNALSRLTSPSS